MLATVTGPGSETVKVTRCRPYARAGAPLLPRLCEGAEQQIDILKKKIEEMVVPISLAYYFKTISNQHSVGHVKYRIELGIILIVLIAKVNLDIFKNFATFYPNNLFSFD